jgi:hypothetical protein
MKRYLQIALILIAPALGLAQNTVTVVTDRAKYFPSDTITVTFTYRNNSDTTTLLSFSSACQYNFCVDTSWCWNNGCAMVLTSVSIPPHSTHSWTCHTPAGDFSVGTHALVGWIGEPDSSQRNYGTGNTMFAVRVNEVTVSTDRTNYKPGDPIDISITYWNNTDTTTHLVFPSYCQFDFAVDSLCWGCLFGCFEAYTYVVISPRDSYTWSASTSANLSYGTHSVVGWVGGLDSNYHVMYGKGRTTFTIDSIYTINCEMQDGWNMISLPLPISETNKDSLFSGNTSHAFTFDKGYKSTDILQHGTGYWLKFAGARSIIFQGYPLLVDTIDVTPGWHMIGSLSVPILRTSITSLPPGIVNQVIGLPHCYSVEGGWFTCDQDHYIRPGQAYWVKILSPGKIILDGRK